MVTPKEEVASVVLRVANDHFLSSSSTPFFSSHSAIYYHQNNVEELFATKLLSNCINYPPPHPLHFSCGPFIQESVTQKEGFVNIWFTFWDFFRSKTTFIPTKSPFLVSLSLFFYWFLKATMLYLRPLPWPTTLLLRYFRTKTKRQNQPKAAGFSCILSPSPKRVCVLLPPRSVRPLPSL